MEIRQLEPFEIDEAITLIWEVFLQFEAPDYSDEGIQSFKDFIENDEILKTLEFFGAYEQDELKGVIATSENRKHICCFFVKAKYHRQGIGRTLWEYVLNHSERNVLKLILLHMLYPFIVNWGLLKQIRNS